MYIGPRDEKACALEIESVEEYSQRMFTTTVDLVAFRSQIRDIIVTRIADYIFQRYRDWPIADLLKLENAIEAEAVKRAGIEPGRFKGDRRSKRAKEESQVTEVVEQ